MKLFCLLPAMFVAVVGSVSGAAVAEHNHDHVHGHGQYPKFGGIVTAVKDVDFELVAKPDLIQLHLRSHGTPIDISGGGAKGTILVGTEKREFELAPTGDRFEYAGPVKVAAGAKVVVVVNLPGKPTATARFALK